MVASVRLIFRHQQCQAAAAAQVGTPAPLPSPARRDTHTPASRHPSPTCRKSCSMCACRLASPRSRATRSTAPGWLSSTWCCRKRAPASSAAATCSRSGGAGGRQAGRQAGNRTAGGLYAFTTDVQLTAAACTWWMLQGAQGSPQVARCGGWAHRQVAGGLQKVWQGGGARRGGARYKRSCQQGHAAVPDVQCCVVRRGSKAAGGQQMQGALQWGGMHWQQDAAGARRAACRRST